MMRHGVHIPEDKRDDLARRAYRLRRAGNSTYDIAADLDVSEPTARNLVARGRTLKKGAQARASS